MTTAARLSELDALIDDLTIDAYGDEEQLSGFLVGAEGAFEDGSPHRSSACRFRSPRSIRDRTPAPA